MELSLEHLDPTQAKRFLRKLCIVRDRKIVKQYVAHGPLENIKSPSKQFKAITYHKDHIALELKNKIHELESELQKTKQERDRAVVDNKKQIDELNLALLSVKTKMNEYIEVKKKKGRAH